MRLDNAYIIDTETSIKTLKKEDGFTLIEVLIAITIFAVGLLAVAVMQTSAIKMNSTAGKLSNLSTWGMDKIEELSALPYDSPWLEVAGNPPGGTDTAGETHRIVSGDYTISWTVIDIWTVIDSIPVLSTKNITVTVTGRGKTANISFLRPAVGS